VSKGVSLAQEFTKGLWGENPNLRQLLGMCPTLAVSTSVINGIGMGVAATFVLVCSSVMISLIRKLVPGQVRIATYIVVIATFVTLVDLSMKAWVPALSASLGAFIPLIVVNCIILGRAEAFASKNGPWRSTIDALGMGAGFTATLLVLGAVRELLGAGQLMGRTVLPGFEPWIVMIMPAGAFLVLGLMLGTVNLINHRRQEAARRALRTARLQQVEA
jgi:Na+-translocating ferredoxin:NAD+ oxidoreductase subunit E